MRGIKIACFYLKLFCLKKHGGVKQSEYVIHLELYHFSPSLLQFTHLYLL